MPAGIRPVRRAAGFEERYTMAYALPALPYPADALEPYVDKLTMSTHHGGHHAASVKRLNAALNKHPELRSHGLATLLRNIHTLPSDIRAVIRNDGGAHANHSLFWKVMSPESVGAPSGPIEAAIDASFGGFDAFKEQFLDAALGHVGSGWVWVITRGGQLAITTTPNEDSLLMYGQTPLFGVDLWEHAYYLRYQSRRANYINAWWHVVDWDAINTRMSASRTNLVGRPGGAFQRGLELESRPG